MTKEALGAALRDLAEHNWVIVNDFDDMVQVLDEAESLTGQEYVASRIRGGWRVEPLIMKVVGKNGKH